MVVSEVILNDFDWYGLDVNERSKAEGDFQQWGWSSSTGVVRPKYSICGLLTLRA
jgi:hypothetical protein